MPSDATRFYLASFWELSTERQVGQVLGQIPETRVREHAARAGLSDGNMTLFRAVIRALDGAYLEWASKRQRSAREQ